MSLSDSQFSWVLGALLLLGSLTEYEVISVQVLENNISPFATWIFVGSIMGAYLLSQRSLGELSDWEMGAFAVGLGGFGLYQFIPEVQSLITEYQPHSGIGLTVVTMIAFYILTNEDI